MNPRDYQAFAERLMAVPTPSAADCRSAISRTYYACFNVGAEWLRASGFPIGRGAGAHGEVRHCLNNCGDPEVAAASSKLSDLHTERNRADYQLDRLDVERPKDARATVQKAATVIRALDVAFNGPGKARLQVSIQTWRRANGYP
jgi:hypothetical protein